MSACVHCSGVVEWDDDAGSPVCTACGTLADPSQTVFSSQPSFDDFAAYTSYEYIRNTTFKGKRGIDLAGQDSATRTRKNTVRRLPTATSLVPQQMFTLQTAVHEFINSMSRVLVASSLASRACFLFDEAMRAGQFRWGARARHLAGACFVLSLREAKRPDALYDIAQLLQTTQVRISRLISTAQSLLHISFPSSDPCLALLDLHAYMASHMALQPSIQPCLEQIRPLSLENILESAKALMKALVRLSPTFDKLTSSQTACAVYLLAIEGELRSPLAKTPDIAALLGERFHVAKSTVMRRLEAIRAEVLQWQSKLPWLVSHQKDGRGRSNVPKRTLVARNLKDVVRWQDDIWNKMVEEAGRPALQLPEPDDDTMSESSASSDDSFTSTRRKLDDLSLRPAKRRRTDRDLYNASQFLLDPLSGPVPSSSTLPQSKSLQPIPISSYVLAAQSNPLATTREAPTRLQLLCTSRGGEAAIGDDELFDSGEWEEEIRRADDERLILQHLWFSDEEFQSADIRVHEQKTQKRSKDDDQGGRSKRSSKINLDALAMFMEEDKDDDGLEYLALLDTEEKTYEDIGEDVILESWRPMSP